ncbi:MAG: YqgE/AlgH family protein [Verrucomicrobia bacterium]|nr:YqgE/AlgH family protein [Verrucomicrobiota bacterium]
MAKRHKSLQGQFLLDGGKLVGSYFHRAAVLVCQHDAKGALGLVLTQPAGPKVGEAITEALPEVIASRPLFLGGPVQPQEMSFLYADPLLLDGNVMPGLKLGHTLPELLGTAEGPAISRRLLVFAGYAGWTAGQLDGEMTRGAWLTHPASIDLIFSPNPEKLWRTLVATKGPEFRLLAEGPDDLSLN